MNAKLLQKKVEEQVLDSYEGMYRLAYTYVRNEADALDIVQESVYRDFDTLEALNVLDEKERAVVVLRFFEDRKLAEIAEVLGENINTVKTVLYRSLRKLKIELREGELFYEG